MYPHNHYTTLVRAVGVPISMDDRGRALDNIFTEPLWRTVKYKEVYLNADDTPREARVGLSRYFQFYNHERGHQVSAIGHRRRSADTYRDDAIGNLLEKGGQAYTYATV